jgi:import inner membrane translocase subunit TIM23
MSGSDYSETDSGAPLPSFDASKIKLTTIAPALGVPSKEEPDYLEYDTKGRGVVTTMFANSGLSYLIGTGAGGIYGLREGLTQTPSHRFKVKLNSVLNHCSRHGSRIGNRFGVLSIMYSLYEGAFDQLEIDQYTGPIQQPLGPVLAGFLTGVTYKSLAGPRVAALTGTIGLGAVGATYVGYAILGIPYGAKGWLFF